MVSVRDGEQPLDLAQDFGDGVEIDLGGEGGGSGEISKQDGSSAAEPRMAQLRWFTTGRSW